MNECLGIVFTKEFDGEHCVKAEDYTELIDLLLKEKKENKKLSDKLEMLRARCFEGVEKDFDKGNYDKLRIMGNIDNTYEEQKKRISELETELSVKEDLLKIAKNWKLKSSLLGFSTINVFPDSHEEETGDDLPFQDEQYEEEERKFMEEDSKEVVDTYIEYLQDQHQDDCIRINELTVSLNKIVDLYANLRKQMGLV